MVKDYEKLMVNSDDLDMKVFHNIGGAPAICLGLLYILTSVFTTFWILFVGFRLLRHT